MVEKTLQQQKENGSWSDSHWDKALPQTFFSVSILRKIVKENVIGDAITKEKINNALNRGNEFINQCYEVVKHQGKECAGFVNNPNESRLNPLATAMGIANNFNPDLYFKWSDPKNFHQANSNIVQQ